MIRLARIPALFFMIAAAMPLGVINVRASGEGVLKNNIVPAEGRLFYPDDNATRGTAAMALYNIAC